MFDVSDTAYDNFMGRYSMRLAPAFADFAGVEAGWRVLDVGAGTGALTAELVRRGVRAAAIDPSPSFAASLARRLPDVDVEHGPAEELPVAGRVVRRVARPARAHVHERRAARRRGDAPRRQAGRCRRRVHVGPRRDGDARGGPPDAAVPWRPAARRPRRERRTGRVRRSKGCSPATASPMFRRSCSRSRRSTAASTSSGRRSAAVPARPASG